MKPDTRKELALVLYNWATNYSAVIATLKRNLEVRSFRIIINHNKKTHILSIASIYSKGEYK
jgi:hypothetical protein